MDTNYPRFTKQLSVTTLFQDYSAVVGTSPVLLFPILDENIGHLRISNVSPVSNGPTLWISRSLGSSVAPYTPGAIPLVPGEYEGWDTPKRIPINAVWAVADADGCLVTVDFG